MSVPTGERLATLETQMTALIDSVAKLQGSVDSLRTFQNWLMAGAATIGAMFGLIAPYLPAIISKINS